jgi:hypothetical protein
MTSDDVSLPPLPSVLADQVELIRAQFDPQGQTSAEALLRLVDAGLARARGELDALEAVLRNARPAPLTVALGLGW